MNTRKSKQLFEYFYFIFSSISVVSMLGYFRPMKFKIFLFLLMLISCGYIFVLRRDLMFRKSTKKEINISMFLVSILFFDFYFNANNLRDVRMMNIINRYSLNSFLDEKIIFIIIGLIFSFIGYYYVKMISVYVYLFGCEIYNVLKTYKYQFGLLLVINISSFIAIIRANYYYTDDLGRTIYGYDLTGSFSRYVSNILSEIIHANAWLADISPLPQIIAIVVISVTGIILLSIFVDLLDLKVSKLSFIVLIPMCMSPYFLSCLSYKYDAPYMALSVLATVFPLIFYKNKTLKYCFSIFIGTLIMCMTYQVSSGIFPMLVLIIGFIMWIKKIDCIKILKFILKSAISYGSALLVFRILIMSPVYEGNYVDVRISIDSFILNVRNYFSFVNNDFPMIWKAIMIFIIISFIFWSVKYTKRNKLITGFISVLTCIIAGLLSFGVYIVFNNPLMTPRAFYGIGIFITLLSIPMFLEQGYRFSKLSIICLSWMFVVYAFIYGNALNVQKEYVDFRTEQVINDLNNLDLLENNEYKYKVIGTSGYHKSVKNMIVKYPVLERQIPILFSDTSKWFWGTFKFVEYYGLNIEVIEDENIDISSSILLKDTYYYQIYKLENIIIIELNDVESEKNNNS